MVSHSATKKHFNYILKINKYAKKIQTLAVLVDGKKMVLDLFCTKELGGPKWMLRLTGITGDWPLEELDDCTAEEVGGAGAGDKDLTFFFTFFSTDWLIN